MQYEVLKNINPSEGKLKLSLVRGEIRDDLDEFSEPYMQWLVEEKYLAVVNSSDVEETEEELEDTEEELEDTPSEDETEVDKESEEDEEDEEDTASNDPESEDDEVAIGSPEDETEDEEEDEDEDEEFPDFTKMSITDVKEYAKAHNVDIAGLKKKNDIIDAIHDELAE